jgi:hypothetical protein
MKYIKKKRKKKKIGCLEYHIKYIEQNCLSYFLIMQSINRGSLAVVALIYSLELMAAR